MERKTTLFERISALIVALAMLFSMMPVQVFAENADTSSAQTQAVQTEAVPQESTPAPAEQPVVQAAEGEDSDSSVPTPTPTVEPDQEPTPTPTVTPDQEPTATPTATPDQEPTATPTATPDQEPTATPTATPNQEPTATPTATPIPEPTPVPQFAVSIAGGKEQNWDHDVNNTFTLNANVTVDFNADADKTTYKWEVSSSDVEIQSGADPNEVTLTTDKKYLVDPVTVTLTVEQSVGDNKSSKSAIVEVNVQGTPKITAKITPDNPAYGDKLTAKIYEDNTEITKNCALTWENSEGTSIGDGAELQPNAGSYTLKAVYKADNNRKESTAEASCEVARKELHIVSWEVESATPESATPESATPERAAQKIATKEYDGSTEFVVKSVVLADKDGNTVDDVEVKNPTANADAPNVGQHTLTLNVGGLSDDANYELLKDVPTIQAEIVACPVMLQKITFKNKTYDATKIVSSDTASYTFAKASGTPSETLANEIEKLVASGLTFTADKNVGTHNVTINGASEAVLKLNEEDAANYSWDKTKLPSTTVDVTPCEVTIELNGSIDKVSDGDAKVTVDPASVQLTASGFPAAETDVKVTVNSVEKWAYRDKNEQGSDKDVLASDTEKNIIGVTSDDFTFTLNNKELSKSNYAVTIGAFTGKIAPIPVNTEVNLTQENGNTLDLGDGNKVVFRAATATGTDEQLWFTGDNALTIDSDAAFYSYKDSATSFAMDETKNNEQNLFENIYVKTADNKVYGSIKVKYAYDNTAPVITVDSLTELEIGEHGQNVQYAITVSDTGSGVAEVRYYVSTVESETQIPSDAQWEDGNLTDGKITITVPAKGYVYVRAMDMTENTSGVSTFHPLVSEQTPPKVSIDVDSTKSANTHTITYSATDNQEPSSGLRFVTLTLKEQNRVVANTVIDSENEKNNKEGNPPKTLTEIADYQEIAGSIGLGKGNLADGEYTVEIVAQDFCGNTSATPETASFIIDNTAPTAEIKMGKTDADGEYYYKKDDAQVDITLSDANLAEGLTYTIQVDGKALSDHESKVTTDGNITLDKDVLGTLSDGEHTLTLTVKDAAGNISLGKDITVAGMKRTSKEDAEGVQVKIIIDNTAPKAEIRMGKTTAADNGEYYYKEDDAQVGITLGDANIAEGLTYTIQVDGKALSNHESEVTTDGNITLDEKVLGALSDDTHTLTLTVSDVAGNASLGKDITVIGMKKTSKEEVKGVQAQVVIDNTAPTVELKMGGDNKIEAIEGTYYLNADVCGATVEVTDTNVGATLENAVYSVEIDDVKVEAGDVDGAVRTMTIPKETIANLDNGNKTITVTAIDAAGNKATDMVVINAAHEEKTMTAQFNLDTKAPELVSVTSPDSYDGKIYDEGIYYTYNKNNNNQIVVTYQVKDGDGNNNDTNNYYDNDAYRKVTVTKNGNDFKAADNVKIEYNDKGQFTVTIPVADEVAHDVYDLTVYAQDKAKNLLVLSSSFAPEKRDAQEGKEGTFHGKVKKIVDTVKPVVTISYNDTADNSVNTNHYYSEGEQVRAYYSYSVGVIEATFDAEDASGIDDSKITVGYKTVKADGTYEQTEGESLNKATCTLDIKDEGDYNFTVFGTDKAGNNLTVKEKSQTADGADGVVDVGTNDGYGTQENKYVGYPKTLDLTPPIVVVDYTELDDGDSHYYPNEKASYYKDTFKTTYTFSDNKGLDTNLIFTGVNVAADSDYVVLGSEIMELNDRDARDVTKIITADRENHSTDGRYRFSVYGEDKAGNPLSVVEKKKKSNEDNEGGTDVQLDCNGKNRYTSEYEKVLDTIAPVFTLALEAPEHPDIAVDENNRAYYNKNIDATFTITDTNLDTGKVKNAIAGKSDENFNYDTEELNWVDITLDKDYNGAPKTEINLPVNIINDGIYRFEIKGEDRAGNLLVKSDAEKEKTDFRATLQVGDGQYWTYIKVRDTVAPLLDVELTDGSVFYQARLGEKTNQNNTYYNLSENRPYRKSNSASGTLTKTDCSPVSVEYVINSTTSSQTENGSAYNHDPIALSFNGEQVFNFTKLVVRDRAGNVSTMPKATNKIYLDVTAPTEDELAPTVAVVAKESGEGRSVAGRDLFSSNVTVQANVTDPGENVRSSGLYQVYYEVLVNDADWTDKVSVSGKGSVTQPGIIGYGTSGKDYASTDAVDETIISQDTIDFAFDANTFNYNDIKIYVWAEDNSGNILTKAEAAHYFFGIDITTPKIEVRYDNNDAQNEKYFKDDRTATVTITERNFDPSQTVITTESKEISSWTYQAGSMANGDDDKWIATVTYAQDGDYTFDVSTVDLVGHTADPADYGDSVAPREFTIDKTRPIINIHFDNDDVRNGKYYNAARVATVSIEEHNFSTDGVTLTTTANIQEGSVVAPNAGGWSSGSDMNTATVSFTEDGNYTMHVEYVDLAGNEAEPQDVDEFVVDTTAPELTFSINDEAFDKATYTPHAYNGEVIPSITYHDINYDMTGTQMSIVGAKNVDSQILGGAPAEDAMGGVYTCENIAETPENDDVYTCTGKVVDMAGNESTVDFVFSVNRYGSNYLLDDATQQLVDSYYTNKAPDLAISEINVNTLKFEEITYALNGDIKTLEPNKDYSVQESGTETSWKQYDYNVFSSNFTQEGVYDITIYSEDEAGNSNSNHTERVKEYSKNISFVLDQTAPSITISGVEEDGRYDTDTRLISVGYSENFAIDTITITNGDKTDSYTADKLNATGGTLEFQIPASNNKQVVTVTATDKAGNIVTVDSPRFLLTSNKLIQFVNNTPLLVGTIVLVLLIVLAIIDYLRKGFLFVLLHRKKSESEN